jgi:hypothetical protein
MKLYKFLFLLILVTLIAAISVTVTLIARTPAVEETKPQDAQSLVDGITYAKAENGLCFGVVTVSRIDSNLHTAINQMITNVPCNGVGL